MRLVPTLLLGCAVILPRALAAQDTTATHPPISASHMAAARELIEAVHMTDAAAAGAQVTMDQQIRLNPEMAPFRATMLEWAASVFGSEEARVAFARMYADIFTEDEIRQLVAFYRTPLGQKLAASQAPLALRAAELGRNLATAHQDDLIRRLQAAQPKP